MWFDTWEGLLVELGSARSKREGEDHRDSIVLFDGQKARILNIDEIDRALDNTC